MREASCYTTVYRTNTRFPSTETSSRLSFPAKDIAVKTDYTWVNPKIHRLINKMGRFFYF